MKGSTIYDFGDFGGLLVLAENRVETKTIYFSWNGGETFDYVQLPYKVKKRKTTKEKKKRQKKKKKKGMENRKKVKKKRKKEMKNQS